MIKNIIVCLFFWLVGIIMGGYYFYNVGIEIINDRMVVAAFNAGDQSGFSRALYLMFDEYIKDNPYKLED